MDFDHRDPAEKSFNISTAIPSGKGYERVLVEAAKCDIVCANCHRERTWGQYNRARLSRPQLSAPYGPEHRSECKNGHPFNEENTRMRKHADGRTSRRCKECDRASARKAYAANSEKYNESNRSNYAANRERFVQYAREYRKKFPGRNPRKTAD